MEKTEVGRSEWEKLQGRDPFSQEQQIADENLGAKLSQQRV